MKKRIILALALVAMLALAACGKQTTPTPTNTPTATTAPKDDTTPTPTEAVAPTEAPFDPAAKSEGVMTYAQYDAAELDTDVVIECYVQATQSWYNDKIVVYAADPDGAYLIYNMTCSEADAKKLVKGTKIKVTGTKTAWSGEVEIKEGATFEFEEGTYVVDTPVDVTTLLGTADLEKKMNQFVTLKGLVIEPSKDADGNDAAFLYKWNGAGKEGDDLYFNVNYNGNVYAFTVESYLCGPDTDVYKAVKNLKIGDVIDLEGFLYWYNNPQPHTTSVKVTGNIADKSAGVMTYAEYAAAELDTDVVIECFVQDTQSWWENKITVYAADLDGGYFIYNMACAEADAKKLVPGTKIKVTGTKVAWSDEVEIKEGATFEIEEGSYIAPAIDLTSLFGKDEDLTKYMNRRVVFKDVFVSFSISGEDGNKHPWLYKYNGSGSEGDDLYFEVGQEGNEAFMTFVVESYFRDKDSDTYKAVKELNIYDTVDIECYLYWYKVAQPHVISVTKKAQ
ncbi:MAG: hypothetical protein J6113_08825 [Lachnospiraceae bacterium]|nr:hypothetical protein [Lachnospiraceae bacterium]